ncbi:hypothetical protein [Mucilaginibacter terrae]|uniref:Uncharacterized protein n=1 Tax=Mucilaginibacter terrae TaxID=1955052 RepID=A0ABU3GNF3_9SPHI|nr:hypothetical protein [Mucilaginibacter terrae]MDT3401313.1 hypothetical protein [Mucilaginibacter terrae]
METYVFVFTHIIKAGCALVIFAYALSPVFEQARERFPLRTFNNGEVEKEGRLNNMSFRDLLPPIAGMLLLIAGLLSF